MYFVLFFSGGPIVQFKKLVGFLTPLDGLGKVMIIYSSEDPTCGMTDDVCPNPWSYKSQLWRFC